MGSSSAETSSPAPTEMSAMRFEEERLSTFRSWPSNAKVEARKIARAGFFRLKQDESESQLEVKCLWCGCVLSQWDYGDQVMSRHRTASPNCPFILNVSNNVPLIAVCGTDREEEEAGRTQGQPLDQPQPDQADDQEEMEEGEITREEGEIFTDEESANNSAVIQPPLEGPLSEQGHVLDANSPAQQESEDLLNTTDPSMEVDNGEDRPSAEQSPAAQAAGAAESISNPEMFKREAARLRTFSKWPLPYISARDLAKSGFIYTGRSDCVRCVFCGEYVGEWEPSDNPATEHRNLFSHCPFMQGQNVGNIPIAEGESVDVTNADTATEGEDEAGSGLRRRDRYSGPERSVLYWNSTSSPSTSTSRDTQRPNSTGETGIVAHSGPAQSKYSTFESRLRSFRDWPPALKQKPKDLAEAGFYYIGLSDQVKCFYCDGGLRNWQAEDDPWTEHARWFSKCAFVRLIKGDDFIMERIDSHSNEEQNSDPYLQGPSTSSKGSSSRVSDAQIHSEMRGHVAQQALSMGIDASRVKAALIHQLQESGNTYKTVDALLEVAFSLHTEQEDRHRVENGEHSAAVGVADAESRLREVKFSDDISQATASSGNESHDETTAQASSSATPAEAGEPLKPASASDTSNTANTTTLGGDVSRPKSSTSAKENPGADLEQENQRLREQRICKICMDNDIGVVFLPCGHLICCVQCAPALKDCPLCRKPIHGTVKTYMS